MCFHFYKVQNQAKLICAPGSQHTDYRGNVTERPLRRASEVLLMFRGLGAADMGMTSVHNFIKLYTYVYLLILQKSFKILFLL